MTDNEKLLEFFHELINLRRRIDAKLHHIPECWCICSHIKHAEDAIPVAINRINQQANPDAERSQT